MGTIKKYLIAGLVVWLPLAATVIIVKAIIDILDSTILLLPVEYRPETILGFSIPGFGVVLALATLILTGALAANLFGRQFVSLSEALLNRIPLVRSIYNSVKQITATVLTSNNKAFRKVVLVEYPREGTWSMGFLTNEHIDIETEKLDKELAAVFVPTTPNPTSGFIVMLPKENITELDLSIEDGFKYIISLGVIVPDKAIKDALISTKVA